MSLLHTSTIGDVTRGGQLLIHFFRMLGQVIRKFAHVLLVILFLMSVAFFFHRTESYQRYVAVQYAIAQARHSLFRDGVEPMVVRRRDGTEIRTSVGEVVGSPSIGRIWRRTVATAIGAFMTSLVALATLFLAILWFIYRTGWVQRQDRLLRGGQMLSAPEASRLLRSAGAASDLTVAGVPLIAGTETGHILVAGTTGSGKTQALLELLRAVRRRGDRVVCFSPSGDFINAFYREGRDTVLNPFDARCPSWDLWGDCPHIYDYDGLAAALISPVHTTSDPFWNDSARKVFSAAVRRCKDRKRESIRFLIHMLTIAPLQNLYELLERTPAGPLLDPSSEKTAISVRSNVANYTSALRYLPLGRPSFRLREWVAAERSDEWIFLNAADAQLASVRPLLSMWIEVLTNALLSLPPSRSRRIWLVIDELPALQKIPSLEDFLARSRKHGGCGVLAIQGLSQLQDRYGTTGAQTITNLCNTWVGMLQKDPQSAKWLADAFGQAEFMESNTGLSYGSNEIRDGVSLSNQRKLRPLVLESEIMSLPPMAGFLRLGGGLPGGLTVPGVRFSFRYRAIRGIAPAFIPGENTTVLPEIHDDTAAPKPAPPAASTCTEPAPSGEVLAGERPPGEPPPPEDEPIESTAVDVTSTASDPTSPPTGTVLPQDMRIVAPAQQET
jgi:type IV conjugative transfer system coupling protein TraD